MKKVIGVLGFCTFFAAAQAQLPDAVNKAKDNVTTAAGPGKLLTQIGSALKTTSLLSSFSAKKPAWLDKASKVSDAVGMASSISSLAGGIKPDMFKSGFNVQNLIQTAGTVKTLASAAGLLKNLEGGIKPEAFASSWAGQESTWQNALSLIK